MMKNKMREIPLLSKNYFVRINNERNPAEKFDRLDFPHPALKSQRVALWSHSGVHMWTFEFLKDDCYDKNAKIESDIDAGRFMNYSRR